MTTTALISTTNPDHLTDSLIARMDAWLATAPVSAQGTITREAWLRELGYLETIRAAMAAGDVATVTEWLPVLIVNRPNIRFFGGNPWTDPAERLVTRVCDALYRESRDAGNWAKAAR